jgi:hypothetical protein
MGGKIAHSLQMCTAGCVIEVAATETPLAATQISSLAQLHDELNHCPLKWRA